MFKLLLGPMFLGVGIYMVIKSFSYKKNGVPVEGTIKGYQQQEGHMFPVVEYTLNGEELIKTSSIAHKKPKYSEGDRVNIYHLEKENFVVIEGENGEFKNGIVIALLGAAITVLTILKYFGF